MRTLKNLVLASAAAGALALGGAAFAKDAPQTHVMTLALPDGDVATIQYQGARPQVTITPGALTPAWAAWLCKAWYSLGPASGPYLAT